MKYIATLFVAAGLMLAGCQNGSYVPPSPEQAAQEAGVGVKVLANFALSLPDCAIDVKPSIDNRCLPVSIRDKINKYLPTLNKALDALSKAIAEGKDTRSVITDVLNSVADLKGVL